MKTKLMTMMLAVFARPCPLGKQKGVCQKTSKSFLVMKKCFFVICFSLFFGMVKAQDVEIIIQTLDSCFYPTSMLDVEIVVINNSDINVTIDPLRFVFFIEGSVDYKAINLDSCRIDNSYYYYIDENTEQKLNKRGFLKIKPGTKGDFHIRTNRVEWDGEGIGETRQLSCSYKDKHCRKSLKGVMKIVPSQIRICE